MSTSDRLPPGDPLRAYIEKVLELLHRSEDKSPTSLELDAVARELGLSPGDRARLESTAADALARGQGFLEHGRPQDAVAELETAAALRPDHVETLHALASARAALAVDENSAPDDAAARALVRRTLALEPRHDPSFELLNRLDAAQGRGQGARGPSGRRRAAGRLWLAVGLSAVVLLFVLVLLLLRKGAPAAHGGAEAVRPAVSPSAGASPVDVSSPPGAEVAAVGGSPPVALGQGRQEASLALEAELATRSISVDVKASWFDRYPEHTYYNAWLLMRNDGKGEVTELHVETLYLDAEERVLKQQLHYAVSSLRPPARPGDTVPVRIISEVPPGTTAARLHLVSFESRPASPAAAAKRLDVKWVIPKPAGVELEVDERWAELSENSMKGGYWHKIIFEVRNTGTVPLRELRFSVLRYDAADVMQQADTLNVAWSMDMPLFVGEARILSSLDGTPVPIKRYAVEVTGAAVGLREE